jgi:nitroreductase
MDVYEALQTRRSVRGFTTERVPDEVLERIFAAAQRAPSWCNIQPWRVWLTRGETTERLKGALLAAAASGLPEPAVQWPPDYPEPYGARRKECGVALYGAMGIAREDRAARHGAWLRNYEAFGAPHIAIVAFDPRFREYGALDLGCWLQSVLLAATAEGLAACAQASLAAYPAAVRNVLDVPAELAILFGVAVGYEDPRVPANACRTDRQPLEENVKLV